MNILSESLYFILPSRRQATRLRQHQFPVLSEQSRWYGLAPTIAAAPALRPDRGISPFVSWTSNRCRGTPMVARQRIPCGIKSGALQNVSPQYSKARDLLVEGMTPVDAIVQAVDKSATNPLITIVQMSLGRRSGMRHSTAQRPGYIRAIGRVTE